MLQTHRNSLVDHVVLLPASRRSPRAVLESQKLQLQLQHDYDDSDTDPDEAAPPPIARSRSNSLTNESSLLPSSRQAYPLHLNPLGAHPVDTATPGPSDQSLYPFQPRLQSPDPTPPVPPPRRRSRGLKSYRTNKRLPRHLRRQASLETIASVTTTASDDYADPPEAEAPSPDWFTLADDTPATPPPTVVTSKASSPSINASSTKSSSGSSRHSSIQVETPSESTSNDRSPPQSLFRKMMPRKAGEPPRSPTHLVIERTVSVDQTSDTSTLSNPTTSQLHDGSLNSGSFRGGMSQPNTSSEWSASSFDISTLTEAEIKRCKKKGINAALYAEMRAAKKGKWTSPIAGNTFL